MVAYHAEKLQPYDSQEGIDYIDFDQGSGQNVTAALLDLSHILSVISSYPLQSTKWQICEW